MSNNAARKALIIVDVQVDFCPGGALAVADGDGVVAPVNEMVRAAKQIVLTQDWHPANHSSFASQNPGIAPFQEIDTPYGKQCVWPDHCVQGSVGADFYPALNTDAANMILRKGTNPAIDSYSAFFENDKITATDLSGWLQARGITELVMAGLATDYCVGWSAVDAARLGFGVTIVMPACRAIDRGGSLEGQITAMRQAGVKLLDTLAVF